MCAYVGQEGEWADDGEAEAQTESPTEYPALSVKRIAQNLRLVVLLSKQPTANDARLAAMRDQALTGAKVPGLSHACNTVAHNVELIAKTSDM